MPALLSACLRFTERVDHYLSSDEITRALDEAVRPTLRLWGVWRITLAVQRGSRERVDPAYIHPDLHRLMQEFWPKWHENGPSFLARYAMRTRRDFSLREAVRAEKPQPADLWINELLQKHGIRDVKYIAVADWWFGVFWSPRMVKLDKHEWRALRIATQAAADRLEELNGREKPLPLLTPQERTVLRLLRDDHSEREVARQLKVSVGTVKQCVTRAGKKMRIKGLRNTICEAVRLYVILMVAVVLACAQINEIMRP